MSFTGTEKHQSGRQITAQPIWSVRRTPSVKTAPELQLPELRIYYRSAAVSFSHVMRFSQSTNRDSIVLYV